MHAVLWVLAGLAACAGCLWLAYLLAGREKRHLTTAVRTHLGGTYVTLPHGVTHYELAGPESGRLVLLIHGLTIPLWTWDPQMDALHSAGLRTLRYDMYGRGYSDRPRVRYDRALFVRQIADLLDTLAVRSPVDIVGTSLGAGIGVTFAAQNPHRVRRVVWLSPLVNVSTAQVRLFRLPLLGELLMRFAGMPFYTRRAIHFYRSHPQRERYVARYLEQISYKGFEYCGLSEARADIAGDYRDAYRAFGATGKASMLIYGADDHEFSPESVTEARQLLVNCESHTIPGVGHGVELQLHPEVTRRLVAFLTRP